MINMDTEFGGNKREVYAFTNRPYEMYLSFLHLPEEFLSGKKILDVGSGLSDFSDITNKKFKDTGTFAVASDLNYSILGKGDFENALFENRGYFEDHSGEDITIDEKIELRKKRKAAVLEQAKQQRSVVAADRDRLPFSDDSFDLIIYNNSLYPSLGRKRYNNLLQSAIREAGRVIKDSGQIRIIPTMFFHDSNGEILLYNAGPIMQPSDESNSDMIVFFSSLQRDGYNFYVIDVQSKEDPEKRWVSRNFVITKTPHVFSSKDIDSEDDERVQIRNLDFLSSKDGFMIPSEVVFEFEKDEHAKD